MALERSERLNLGGAVNDERRRAWGAILVEARPGIPIDEPRSVTRAAVADLAHPRRNVPAKDAMLEHGCRLLADEEGTRGFDVDLARGLAAELHDVLFDLSHSVPPHVVVTNTRRMHPALTGPPLVVQ